MNEIENRELQDECVDMVIRAAFKWQEIKSGQMVLTESEKELSVEDIAHSKLVLERFRREKEERESMIRRMARRETARRDAFRAVGVAACIVLLLSIATPFAVAYIEPIRTRVLGLLIDIGDRYTTISMNLVEIPENWQGSYYMRYLPEGFELTLVDNAYPHVEYKHKSGVVLKFTEHPDSWMTILDSENSDVSKINMGSFELSIIEKETEYTLVWNNGEVYCVLVSDVPKEELLRIAHSVQKVE